MESGDYFSTFYILQLKELMPNSLARVALQAEVACDWCTRKTRAYTAKVERDGTRALMTPSLTVIGKGTMTTGGRHQEHQ